MKIIILLFISLYSLCASIGKVYAIHGKASIQRASATIPITLGASIEEKDLITTKKQTRMQIIFEDRTIVTLAGGTNFEINKYLYDKTENSHLEFKLKKGAFQSVTGALGKLVPHNFKIKTKSSTIGIRGTTFLVKVTPTEDILVTLIGETYFSNTMSDTLHTVKEGHKLTFNHDTKKVEITPLNENDLQLSVKTNKNQSKEDDSESLSTAATQSDENQIPIMNDSTIEDNTADQGLTNLATINSPETGSKITLNTDTHFSYGYWETAGVATTPFSEGDAISSTVVGAYTAFAYYSGNLVSINNGVASTVGNISLSADFGQSTISGNMNLTDAQSQTWDVSFNGNILSNGFTVQNTEITDVSPSDSINYTTGNINGTFYGTGTTSPITGQDGVAGTFSLTGTNTAAETVTVDGSYGAISSAF